MNFKQFINESISSRWQYKLPSDKELQLYDFYMTTLLSGKTGKDNIDVAVEETREILLPSLKKELLNALFYAIATELRYVGSFGSEKVDLANIVLKRLGEKYFNGIENYLTTFNNSSRINNIHKRDHPPISRDENRKISNSLDLDYTNAYEAALKSGLTRKEFVEMAKLLFSPEVAQWDEEYGGTSWINICEGWERLNSAKDLKDLTVWIDHVYDLQHNTDTVFNKLKSYYKSGFKWLENALDFKRDIKNPYELIGRVSPKMKTLALPALKASGNTSLQSYEKDVNDNVSKKVLNYRSVDVPYNFPYTLISKALKIHNIGNVFKNTIKEKWQSFPEHSVKRAYCYLAALNDFIGLYEDKNKKLLILKDIFTYLKTGLEDYRNIKDAEFKYYVLEKVEAYSKIEMCDPSLYGRIKKEIEDDIVPFGGDVYFRNNNLTLKSNGKILNLENSFNDNNDYDDRISKIEIAIKRASVVFTSLLNDSSTIEVPIHIIKSLMDDYPNSQNAVSTFKAVFPVDSNFAMRIIRLLFENIKYQPVSKTLFNTFRQYKKDNYVFTKKGKSIIFDFFGIGTPPYIILIKDLEFIMSQSKDIAQIAKYLLKYYDFPKNHGNAIAEWLFNLYKS